jgi:hypothetical protein
MIGAGDAGRRRREQRRPFARRAPLVVGQRVVIEECIGIGRRRIGRGLEDENFACDLAGGRRMGGIVIQHRRRDARGRREAGRHAVGGDDRHRRPVGDELLDRHVGIVDVRAPVGPIVHDVVVVGDLHIVQVDGAEFLHLGDEEIGVALPASAARIGGAALRLEQVPVPRLIGRDHEGRIDPRKSRIRRGRDAGTLRPQRLPAQHGPGRDAHGPFEEASPRSAGRPLARFAHHDLPPIELRIV